MKLLKNLNILQKEWNLGVGFEDYDYCDDEWLEWRLTDSLLSSTEAYCFALRMKVKGELILAALMVFCCFDLQP